MEEFFMPINKTFAKMLDDTSQCYKYYWLEAIVNFIIQEDREYTFEEIIDEMIVNAWYTVTMYHLHLGTYNPKSKAQTSLLENIIEEICKRSTIEASATKEDILKAINDNKEYIKIYKDTLAINVPYRLLSAFLPELAGNSKYWRNSTNFINYIQEKNKQEPLFYTIIPGKGLNKKVVVNNFWKDYVKNNYLIVTGWIKYKKITYIQARNPGVPGIVNKLDLFAGRRDLDDAKKLWDYVAKHQSLMDVYTGDSIEMNKTHIDHFIPWSYVACDELWNLVPVDGLANVSKSNNLPEWDEYFTKFAKNQYCLYKTIYEYKDGMELFNKCKRANLYSLWANEILYAKGKTEEEFIKVLETNMKPVYMSALMQGYGVWKYERHN